jgi:hypothetical protein
VAAGPQAGAAGREDRCLPDLFDRAEQEELTYRTLETGTVDELRNVFRRGIARP